MFFWNSRFFDDRMDFGNMVSGSSAFSKSVFSVCILLKPSLENFKHIFASVWDECNFAIVGMFLLFCIDHWRRLSYLSLLFFGTLHSNRCIFPLLLCFSLLFTAVCKASSDSHFSFLHFFFLGMVLIPVCCTVSWTSIYSSSGTLSIRSSLLNLFLTSTV